MGNLLLIFGIAAAAAIAYVLTSGPKEGDTVHVDSPIFGGVMGFQFKRLGAGFGWVPITERQFPDGTLAALPGGTHKWFSGLGAFVKV